MTKYKTTLFGFIIVLAALFAFDAKPTYKIGVLKYSGGGDWYANPTAVPNLIRFCNENLKTNIVAEPDHVSPESSELFNYPFIHMTGHGNVVFSAQEVKNLNRYLTKGGFLHIDDNYGMDKFVRREMKKVFPNQEFIELPFSHPIFNQKYKFEKGLPKVHEHDNKPPQAFGLFHKSKLVVLYTYECDLGDGWEDYEVHKDSEETRTKALQMGANIIQFAFQLADPIK
jgi:hypothetical protein